MQTTQHTPTRCPVLLHPACTTNPDAVKAVQQATGRFIVLEGGKPMLASPAPTAISHTEFNLGPFGGDAA